MLEMVITDMKMKELLITMMVSIIIILRKEMKHQSTRTVYGVRCAKLLVLTVMTAPQKTNIRLMATGNVMKVKISASRQMMDLTVHHA